MLIKTFSTKKTVFNVFFSKQKKTDKRHGFSRKDLWPPNMQKYGLKAPLWSLASILPRFQTTHSQENRRFLGKFHQISSILRTQIGNSKTLYKPISRYAIKKRGIAQSCTYYTKWSAKCSNSANFLAFWTVYAAKWQFSVLKCFFQNQRKQKNRFSRFFSIKKTLKNG